MASFRKEECVDLAIVLIISGLLAFNLLISHTSGSIMLVISITCLWLL